VLSPSSTLSNVMALPDGGPYLSIKTSDTNSYPALFQQ
jgi:hypothetical protein